MGAQPAEEKPLTFDVQIDYGAHLGISAHLALVACRIIKRNIFDFQYPLAASGLVDRCKSRVADVGISSGREDFVFPWSEPGDLWCNVKRVGD